MTAGNSSTFITFGKNYSNNAIISYDYVSSGSDDNAIMLGNQAKSDIMKLSRYVLNLNTQQLIQQTNASNMYYKMGKDNSNYLEIHWTHVNGSTNPTYIKKYEGGTAYTLLELMKDKVDIGKATTVNGTLDCSALGNTLKGLIRDFVYPVGSVYISFESTSPETRFGGSWTQITNRFLYCTNSSGAKAGSDTHTHTTGNCTLNVNQIPSHTHTAWTYYGSSKLGNSCGWTPNNGSVGCVALGGNSVDCIKNENTGGGQAHNHGNTGSASNMPPYITVYAWQRTG